MAVLRQGHVRYSNKGVIKMTGRRTTIGLCMLCAIAFSAIAAQSALALGETAYTCAKNEGAKDFGASDSHCSKAKVTPGSGEYGHVAINEKTSTTFSNILTGTERQTTKLKNVQAGVTMELQSPILEGTGTIENKEEGGEMLAHVTGVFTYKEVTVTAPAGKGCKVKGGELITNEVTATTKGLTGQLKFVPAAGETFVEITIEGCSIAALNHLYTMKGSVIGNTEGATTKFTHEGTTAQKTLSFSGQNAGIDGSLTIKGANGNGLALT